MNRHVLHILVPIYFTTIASYEPLCYICDDFCPANATNLPTTTCPQECCYSITTKEANTITNHRNCAEEGQSCFTFCSDYRINLTFTGINVFYCKSCDGHLCNDEQLTEVIKCYGCADCKIVTNETNVVDCNADDGCYLNELDGTIARGCLDICTTDSCTCCYTEKCNSARYNETTPAYNLGNEKYKLTFDDNTTIIKCFECRHCNSVTEETRRVTCSSDACCYDAVVRNAEMGRLYTIRGCLEVGCDSTCKVFGRSHLKNFVGGEMDFCAPCNTDRCNKNEYKLTRKSTIDCFVCKDCETITNRTNLVKCEPSCCYAAVSRNRIVRDCWKLKRRQSCSWTCDYVEEMNMGSCVNCKHDDDNGCNDVNIFI